MFVKRNFFDRIGNKFILRVENEGEGDEGGSGGGGDGDGDEGKGGGEKQLTQSQVDRIVAREKASAERAAKKSFDEWLATQKAEHDKTTMDDAARAKAEADEAKAEGERLRAEAKRERLDAKIERKLGAAGLDDKALARAARLIDLDVDASDDDITAEIDQLREDMPGLFGQSDENENDDTDDKSGKAKKPPSGVGKGGKPPAGGQGTKTAMERGRELWAERKKKTTAA